MLTASVVLYKTPIQQIRTILNCVVSSNCVERLYVIDNFSSEENQIFFKEYPFVEYIEHENTGYGSSHNIALRKAIERNSDYHIVLNPDIIFEAHVIPKIKEYMDAETDTVYLLPKVIYPDGETQHLAKLLPTPFHLIFRRFLPKNRIFNKMQNKYVLLNSGYNNIINPPSLSGCFMFLRVKTLKEKNIFFDERFFMYFEDFDIIRRLHRVGKTIYYPEVTIIHNHNKASYKSKKMLLAHIKSAIQYFNKYGWFIDKERKKMNKQILNEIELLNKGVY
jgi:GT2 family glycosyltransferase